jgi:hypothetical protein
MLQVLLPFDYSLIVIIIIIIIIIIGAWGGVVVKALRY